MMVRLDFFLLSDSLQQLVTTAGIYPGFMSDHSGIRITLAASQSERGPGFWRFNTSLLDAPEFLEKIREVIKMENEIEYEDYWTRWEILKLSIRSCTIKFADRKQNSNRNKIQVLERKLQQLVREISKESEVLVKSLM